MKFDIKWPSWAWIHVACRWIVSTPGYVATRDFLVKNAAVLASSVALMIGLWSGAVLSARRHRRGRRRGVRHCRPRHQCGRRAQRRCAACVACRSVEGTAFVRLRSGNERSRAARLFGIFAATSRPTSERQLRRLYRAWTRRSHYQTDVSANLLCLGGLPFEPERQLTDPRRSAVRRTVRATLRRKKPSTLSVWRPPRVCRLCRFAA